MTQTPSDGQLSGGGPAGSQAPKQFALPRKSAGQPSAQRPAFDPYETHVQANVPTAAQPAADVPQSPRYEPVAQAFSGPVQEAYQQPSSAMQPYAPGPVAPYGYPSSAASGPIGKVRPTGMCVLLMIVTLGIYSFFWYGGVHGDMKRYSRSGLGGGVAVLLAIFFGIVSPFLASSEVGALYTRRGQHAPVSGATGLWIFLPLIGGIIWFVKTNSALNGFWQSQGAR